MISKLSLKNFKAFSSLDSLVIKPITILSGKNSVGKSSILHSLLLLKQSLTLESGAEALTLDGAYLQYSHLRELAFGLPQEPSAKISYDFELQKRNRKTLGNLSFEFRHKARPEDSNRKGTVVSKLSWQGSDDNKKFTIYLKNNEYPWPNDVKINLPPLPKKFKAGSKRLVDFNRFFPELIRQEIIEPKEKTGFGYFPIDFTESSLANLCRDLRRELERMEYLGPSRAIPRRAYVHYTEKHYELDEDGGNAAHVFWLRQDEKVNWLGTKVKLKEGVEACLKMIGFNQPVTPKRSSKIVYQLLVDSLYDPSKKVTIVDVGFGYSQVLPIILRGLLSKDNALLLFEQPEIHLHPSSKAKLADIFIAFSKSNKRLIIETHSTELINCLQLRVIEDPTLKESINVAFIETSTETKKNGAQIRQLSLREDGMFDQWPEGFCDETERLSRRIIEANVKRDRKNG